MRYPIRVACLILMMGLLCTGMKGQFRHRLLRDTLVVDIRLDDLRCSFDDVVNQPYSTVIFEEWHPEFPLVPHPETVHTLILSHAGVVEAYPGIDALAALYPQADTIILGWNKGAAKGQLSGAGPVFDLRSILVIKERNPDVSFRIGGESYLYTGAQSMKEGMWAMFKAGKRRRPVYSEPFLNPESVFYLPYLYKSAWTVSPCPDLVKENFSFCADSLVLPVVQWGWGGPCPGLLTPQMVKKSTRHILYNASLYLQDQPFEWFESVDSVWFLGNDSDYVFDLPDRFFEMHEPRVILFGCAPGEPDWVVHGVPHVSISVAREVVESIRVRWPGCEIVFGENAWIEERHIELVGMRGE